MSSSSWVWFDKLPEPPHKACPCTACERWRRAQLRIGDLVKAADMGSRSSTHCWDTSSPCTWGWSLADNGNVAMLIGEPDKSWRGYRSDGVVAIVLLAGNYPGRVMLTFPGWLERL